MASNLSRLTQLKRQVIVSVQAENHEPFHSKEPFLAMVQSVLNGGAKGLRLAGIDSIRWVREVFGNDLPIIGLTKPDKIPVNFESEVYITPAFNHVANLAEAGADIVAMDATGRTRPGGETLGSIVEQTRTEYPKLLLMADIATLEEGLSAENLGFDMVSTTLSGYTQETLEIKTEGPDFALLIGLVNRLKTPVVLEGRVWHPSEVKQAFDLGAFSVVIGSAITRPHQITQRFIGN